MIQSKTTGTLTPTGKWFSVVAKRRKQEGRLQAWGKQRAQESTDYRHPAAFCFAASSRISQRSRGHCPLLKPAHAAPQLHLSHPSSLAFPFTHPLDFLQEQLVNQFDGLDGELRLRGTVFLTVPCTAPTSLELPRCSSRLLWLSPSLSFSSTAPVRP